MLNGVSNRPLRILMVSSEVFPFSKSGGLADVVGALPKYLARLGHEVKIITPRYLSMKENARVPQINLQLTVDVSIRDEIKLATLWQGKIPLAKENEIPVVLIDQAQYFDRPAFYQENGIDYPDNAFRFSFFCRAVLETIKKINWVPDIIHCHDWQSALVPLFSKEHYRDFQEIKMVFTFHNANFHGLVDPARNPFFLGAIGLREELFNMHALEYYGRISLLKAGLVFTDAVNTVSPTYAREVQGNPIDPNDKYDYGAGLTKLYQKISKRFKGILNGLDYETWDPEKDEVLGDNKFNEHTMPDAKKKIKEDLQRQFRLAINSSIPLIGAVGRIDPGQKGYDLLLPIVEKLANEVQIILLGAGDPNLLKTLKALSERCGKTFHLQAGHDEQLARRIYAGSDIFLMPSRYEPCGLTQMISLRYGTIPIVRATGGLADTIIDIESDREKGNGFVFKEYNSAALEDVIRRTIKVYKEGKNLWETLRRRGMAARFSWEDSARKYEEFYRSCLG